MLIALAIVVCLFAFFPSIAFVLAITGMVVYLTCFIHNSERRYWDRRYKNQRRKRIA